MCSNQSQFSQHREKWTLLEDYIRDNIKHYSNNTCQDIN